MEKLSHAYIVSSASENARMGKAFYLAEKMLCQSEGERPCGVCRDCRKVKARVHPDLAVVERITDDKGKQKKEILVDQVRAMGADAYVLPNEAAEKVYIIKDADTMNEQAQNAALKILEEPPKGVHFILCVSNPERRLWPTNLSLSSERATLRGLPRGALRMRALTLARSASFCSRSSGAMPRFLRRSRIKCA